MHLYIHVDGYIYLYFIVDASRNCEDFLKSLNNGLFSQ